MEVTITIKAPELAAAIQSLADAIVAAGCIPVEIPKTVKEDPTPTEELAQQVELTEEPKTDTAPVVKLEDVRAKLADLMKAGKGDKVKALFSEFGVSKLTALPEDKLPAIMARAEAI